METKNIRVTVWNEYLHEKLDPAVAAVYPDGIHGCIAGFLQKAGMSVKTATLEMPEHGLTEEVLDSTDVLVWWGHMAHDRVDDSIVSRVYDRVQNGMGLILLHSAHASKIFCRLCGTNTFNLKWRESGDREILWTIEPGHPIAEGLGEHIMLEEEETYGERFEIPRPDELVFISWFSGGEVFRSGCCYHPVSYTHLDVYKRQVQIPSAYLLKLFFHEIQQLGIGQHVVGLILKLIKDFLQGGQCVRILILADIL